MKPADRAVGTVAALALIGTMLGTALAPEPAPGKVLVEFPVQGGVTAPPLEVEPLAHGFEAIPPKSAVERLESFVPTPTPPPVPAQPAVTAKREAAPVVERSERAAAPAPEPAPRRDRAADYAAAYGCGGIGLDPSAPAGYRGWYGWGSGVIQYDPADPALGYVIGHECMHARQEWAYGGDIAALEADSAPVGGFEYVADCMSQFVGAGSGGYTSSCGGARGDAARAMLAGQRYP